LVVTVVVGIPALVFVLWPLFGRVRRGRTFLPLPLDRRQELEEEKRVALGAIRELEFEHTAGHVSDADFTELRARYEGEAATILTELDQLGPAEAEPPPARVAPGRPLPPEMLRGMLQAARSSLAQGRYSEAIAAYQAVLKRDPNNVDATTHLGLILAVGGGPEHADRALEIFDRALAIDPNYL